MKKDNKTRIKILSSGLIAPYGHINGPVLTPFYEDNTMIVKLITAGVKVVGVSDNGSETLLTVSNVLSEEKKEVIKEKKEEPVKEEVVETKEETVVNEPESSDEQVVEENIPTTKKDESSEYNYKKNKHKR